MKKILLQAGHMGRTSGATGAPGEKAWTEKTCKQIVKLLEGRVDVTLIGADNWANEVKDHYDLFLAVHYDADIYNDRGGFTDYPEPKTDGATKLSQKYAKMIGQYFFDKTGIPFRYRGNANTRYYYMWKHIEYHTPCVLIEAGVGWRKPEDYTTLRKESTPKHLANAILYALGEPLMDDDTDEGCPGMSKDISSACEKALKLKSYDWYNKKWNWFELIEDHDDWYQKYSKCHSELEDAKKWISESQNVIETLKKDNERLAEQLKSCEVEKARLNGKITSLEAEIADITKQNEELAHAHDLCQEEYDKLKEKYEKCKDGNDICNYTVGQLIKEFFSCLKK